MELNAEEQTGFVLQTFVGTVIEVHKPGAPTFGHRLVVDRIGVVL